MIKLKSLYNEIKLIQNHNWEDEYEKCWKEAEEEIGIENQDEDNDFVEWENEADIDEYAAELFKLKFGFDYNGLKEQSTTGGGVAGASFTPSVGEQYTTPKAFGKNKKYKNSGYKDVPNNQRFKSKTFDISNWKSNKPKYLRNEKEIK